MVQTGLCSAAASLEGVALVDVAFAVGALVAQWAEAAVAGPLVGARGVVPARTTGAMVNRVLTPGTIVPWGALAHERVHVIPTGRPVFARTRRALVHVELAESTFNRREALENFHLK